MGDYKHPNFLRLTDTQGNITDYFGNSANSYEDVEPIWLSRMREVCICLGTQKV